MLINIEHITRKASNVFQHLIKKHSIVTPTLDNITHKLTMSGFQNTLHRKAYESEMIKKFKPSINIQH